MSLLSIAFYLLNLVIAGNSFGYEETNWFQDVIAVLGFASACFIGISGFLLGIRDNCFFLSAGAFAIVGFNIAFNSFMYGKYKTGLIALIVGIVGMVVSFF